MLSSHTRPTSPSTSTMEKPAIRVVSRPRAWAAERRSTSAVTHCPGWQRMFLTTGGSMSSSSSATRNVLAVFSQNTSKRSKS